MNINRDDLRRTVRRMLGELEQSIRDAQWWNTRRAPEFPDDTPLDVEGERVLADLCRQQLAAIDRDDCGEMARLSKAMLEQAQATFDFGEETL